MLDQLSNLKQNLESKGYATRKDIADALDIIKTNKAKRNQEITELVAGIYDGKQTEKLLSDLDSY